MSIVDEVVELNKRKILRKGLTGLRAQGLVPGVIHDHGAKSVHIEAPEVELSKIYREAGKHHPLQLKVGDKEYLALIKDVHMNPIKRRIQHVVFMAIKQDEKVEAEVPIRIEGDIPAEKIGLMILRQLDEVQVEALPKYLPDELVVDGSKLAELHDKITVADLSIPEGVTVLTETDHAIATVVETPAQESEEAEAAEGEEGEAAEGESAEGEKPEGESAEGEKSGESKPAEG